ncbi:MAG: flagellar basal body rod protein FlgB [Pikeienuella sp.]
MEKPPVAFDLTILNMARGLAAHASGRQGLIAENVANADTIGYRARDLRSFAETYDAGRGEGARGAAVFAPAATRPGHLGYDAARIGAPAEPAFEITRLGADSPNGNSVSLEDQMVRGARALADHQLALGVYGKSMDLLRMAIGRR